MRTCSTGGARYAQGLKAKLSNRSQSAALDNPLGSILKMEPSKQEGKTNG
jgi:hypothetical protein